MDNTAALNNFDLSDTKKQVALKKLYQAIVRALQRVKRKTKVSTMKLDRWLKNHNEAIVQEFKTADGISALLISAGTGLFVASLTYNTIIAVAVQQTIATMTAAAGGFISALICAGAGTVIASMAGISAIGIVPLGAGISSASFLAGLGGSIGIIGGTKAVAASIGGSSIISTVGSALGLGTKLTIGGKVGAIAATAIGITSVPAIAPAAAIGMGIAAAGAVLWGIKKLWN